jgi:hypothetical protein
MFAGVNQSLLNRDCQSRRDHSSDNGNLADSRAEDRPDGSLRLRLIVEARFDRLPAQWFAPDAGVTDRTRLNSRAPERRITMQREGTLCMTCSAASQSSRS